METQELTRTETTKQQIELVKGEFTPSEASHVINNLIDVKINFHKLQRLQVMEGEHYCETKGLDCRITELEKEKEIARDFINSIRFKGQNLKISGTLNISIVE